jgi:hypothetical protein
MALEYFLRIATDLKPPQTLDFLARTLQFEVEPDSSLSGPGLTITASAESKIGQSIISEAFNFTPTVRVTFRVDKFDDTELGRLSLLRGTLELVRQLKSDAVLLFNGEDVVLLHAKGELALNEQNGFWTAERLALIDLPYVMRSLESL